MPSREEPLAQQIAQSLDRQVKEQLQLTRSIRHPGESGRARENIVREFIGSTVPRLYDIDTGFVIDALGDISRQVDVVVYRSDYHPSLTIGGIKHFPIESVVAAIENKSRIESTDLLQSALENLASVKRLDKTGGGANRTLVDHEPAALLTEMEHPRQRFYTEVFTAIVAEHSLSPDTVVTTMSEFFTNNARAHWPNYYVSLHEFVGCYSVQEGPNSFLSPICEMADAFVILQAEKDGVPPLVDLLHELLNFIRTAPLIDYSPTAYFGVKYPTAFRSLPL